MKATLLMITLVALVGCVSLENDPADYRRLEGVALTAGESADVIEKEIRKAVNRPRGELNKGFLEEVTQLDIAEYQLTDVSSLAGLKNLKTLYLDNNQLTDISPLMGFTQLKSLSLLFNPNLTKVEIDTLQKALPKCRIYHNAKE